MGVYIASWDWKFSRCCRLCGTTRNAASDEDGAEDQDTRIYHDVSEANILIIEAVFPFPNNPRLREFLNLRIKKTMDFSRFSFHEQGDSNNANIHNAKDPLTGQTNPKISDPRYMRHTLLQQRSAVSRGRRLKHSKRETST